MPQRFSVGDRVVMTGRGHAGPVRMTGMQGVVAGVREDGAILFVVPETGEGAVVYARDLEPLPYTAAPETRGVSPLRATSPSLKRASEPFRGGLPVEWPDARLRYRGVFSSPDGDAQPVAPPRWHLAAMVVTHGGVRLFKHPTTGALAWRVKPAPGVAICWTASVAERPSDDYTGRAPGGAIYAHGDSDYCALFVADPGGAEFVDPFIPASVGQSTVKFVAFTPPSPVEPKPSRWHLAAVVVDFIGEKVFQHPDGGTMARTVRLREGCGWWETGRNTCPRDSAPGWIASGAIAPGGLNAGTALYTTDQRGVVYVDSFELIPEEPPASDAAPPASHDCPERHAELDRPCRFKRGHPGRCETPAGLPFGMGCPPEGESRHSGFGVTLDLPSVAACAESRAVRMAPKPAPVPTKGDAVGSGEERWRRIERDAGVRPPLATTSHLAALHVDTLPPRVRYRKWWAGK